MTFFEQQRYHLRSTDRRIYVPVSDKRLAMRICWPGSELLLPNMPMNLSVSLKGLASAPSTPGGR